MPARSLISALGVYTPSNQQPIRERERLCRTRARIPIERITGIKSVHTAAADEFAIHLAEKAALNCLASSSIKPEEIELLISCSISRHDRPENGYVFEPSTSFRLKQMLGVTEALAFDVSNACAGLFTGLFVADAFIRSGRVRHALVVSGEFISSISDCAMKEISSLFDSKLACLTLGDGAAAVILSASTEEGFGLEDAALYTVPAHSDLCVARFTDQPHGGAVMSTQSSELSRLMAEELRTHIPAFLAKNGDRRVDWVIPHQTSKRSIKEASAAVNANMGWSLCNPDSVLTSLDHYGNTASTSHMLALHDAIQSGKVTDGNTILFSVNASGLNVGSFLYKFDNLPSRMRDGDPVPSTEAIKTSRIPSPARIAGESFRLVVRCDSPDYKALVDDALASAGVVADDIDLLIYAGIYREEYLVEPSLASLIAMSSGLALGENIKENFLCFDILAGPSGMLHALSAASEMMAVSGKHCAMIVCGDADPNLVSAHAPPMGITQATAAIVLRKDGEAKGRFGALHVATDYDRVNGLVRFTKQAEGETFISSAGSRSQPRQSEALIVEVVGQAMAEAGKPIDLFLTPGPIETYRCILGRHLQIPEEQIFAPCQTRTGAWSADLVAALSAARASGRLTEGKLCCFVGFSDISEACCLLYQA